MRYKIAENEQKGPKHEEKLKKTCMFKIYVIKFYDGTVKNKFKKSYGIYLSSLLDPDPH